MDDNFSDIYDSDECEGDFYSCMTDKDYHYFYRDSVDTSAAYLKNEQGKIIARCVIFNKVYEEGTNKIWSLAERQYSTNQDDMLKRALVNALIIGGYIDGYKQVGYDCHHSRSFVDIEGDSLEDNNFYIDCNLGTEDTLSYQDSFKWYDMSEGHTTTRSAATTTSLIQPTGALTGMRRTMTKAMTSFMKFTETLIQPRSFTKAMNIVAALTTLESLFGLTLRKYTTTKVMLTVVLGAVNGT